MTKELEIYKCEICGNIVEVKHEGKGQLVCCGQPMKNIIGNTEDASKEKHVPIITVEGDFIKIKVGEILHPMEEKHYIEWIEVISNENVYHKMLRPGDIPILEIKSEFIGNKYRIRAYCNIHGMWETSNET